MWMEESHLRCQPGRGCDSLEMPKCLQEVSGLVPMSLGAPSDCSVT